MHQLEVASRIFAPKIGWPFSNWAFGTLDRRLSMLLNLRRHVLDNRSWDHRYLASAPVNLRHVRAIVRLY